MVEIIPPAPLTLLLVVPSRELAYRMPAGAGGRYRQELVACSAEAELLDSPACGPSRTLLIESGPTIDS